MDRGVVTLQAVGPTGARNPDSKLICKQGVFGPQVIVLQSKTQPLSGSKALRIRYQHTLDCEVFSSLGAAS